MRLVKSFLVCVLVCFSFLHAFAQPIPKLPTDSKKYRIGDLPSDEKPHWRLQEDEYGQFLSWEIWVGLKAVAGLGVGRSPQEANQDTSNSMATMKFSQLSDFAALRIEPYVYKYKRGGDLYRAILIRLQTSPDEGQSRAGNVTIKLNQSILLLNRVDDLLKIGRNWRNQGTPTEDKRIDLDSVTDPEGDPLGFSIEKTSGIYGQNWYIYSKRVSFVSTTLSDLSKFRDSVQRAIDWLDKFGDTDKISPPK